jgi:hypothetical protein
MIKVYIASPYTLGDVDANVHTQISAAHILITQGFSPYVPLLNHYIHLKHPHSYQRWLKIDLSWIECCDCLLRLPGLSKGADREVKEARRLGMKVFYSIQELLEYYS